MRLAIRRRYIIPIIFLMLTAFGDRAKAQSCFSTSENYGVVGFFGPVNGTTCFQRNQYWPSLNEIMDLRFQEDGNLVLYYIASDKGPQAWWASNTMDFGDFFSLQQDGNVVIYTDAGKPTWATGTEDHENSELDVQDDGNTVIYVEKSNGTREAVWSTKTNYLPEDK